MEVGFVSSTTVVVEGGDGNGLVEEAEVGRSFMWQFVRVVDGILREVQANTAIAFTFRLDAIAAHWLLFVALHVTITAC